MKPTPQKPLTVQEYASLVSVHEETVTKWCRTGRIRAKRFGRLWRIYEDPTKY
jgi:excisionase family DNA binding protein